GLLAELDEVIWPTRGQVVATAPLPQRLFEYPHYARDGFDYWQQVPNGRLVLGGFRDSSIMSELTDVEETTPVIQEALDALLVVPAKRASCQHGAELRRVDLSDRTGLDGVHEVAVVARLLPVVAEDVHPGELRDRDLGLAGPVGSHQAHVLAGAQGSLRDDDLPAGRD